MKKWLLGLLFWGIELWGATAFGQDQNFHPYPSGIILHYYGFGDDIGTIGVPLYRFDEHLQTLIDGAYRIEKLSKLIERISNRDQTLTRRTIAIVVSGGSKTFATRAWEKFQQYGIPVSLFVPIDFIGEAGYLTWQDMRSMMKSGNLEVGVQGRTLRNLLNMPADALEKDLAYARMQAKEQLGTDIRLFAYPFGLTSRSVGRMVYNAGFTLAIGQHSGAFDRTHNRFYLPSFGLTKDYSDADRLKLVLSTLSLPIKGLQFDPLVPKENNPPTLQIDYRDNVKADTLNISCFHSQQGRLDVKSSSHGFSPVFVSPLRKGRSRLNCTAPVAGGGTMWFGYQLYVPN